jgi:hypothetical protein
MSAAILTFLRWRSRSVLYFKNELSENVMNSSHHSSAKRSESEVGGGGGGGARPPGGAAERQGERG